VGLRSDRTSFLSDRLRRDLGEQKAGLFKPQRFLQDLERPQCRVDYIKGQAGLDGKIDAGLEIPKAVKNVSASGEQVSLSFI
jgi:hypothetical protein